MKAALVVSDSSIKLVKESNAVPQCIRIPLEKGVIVNGQIANAAKFVQILQKITATYALKERKMILGLYESTVTTKSTLVENTFSPSESKEEMASHAHLNTLSELYDFIPSTIAEKPFIFATAIDELVIKTYHQAFSAAGLSFTRVETLASAVSRSIADKVHTPSLIVDLEEHEVILSIVSEKGQLQLTSSIPRDGLGSVEELVSEIKGFLGYFYRKYKIGEIEKHTQKAYFQAGFATGEALNDQIKNLFQTSLSIPFAYIPIPKMSHMQDALAFYPVYALLFDPHPAEKRDINLLETAEKEERHLELSDDVKRYLLIGCALLVFYCIVYAGFLGFILYRSSTLDAAVKDAKKQEISPDAANLKAQLSDLDKTIYLLTQLETKDTRIPDTISFIQQKTPEGIVVTHYSIDFEKNTVVVTGVTTDRDTLSTFAHLIESNSDYQNVNVPLTNFEKKGVTPFTVSFEYKQ